MPIPFCMTEEVAKTKWCPFAKTISYGHADAPLPAPQDFADDRRFDAPCIASDCMAWRFAQTNVDDGNGGTKPSGDTHGYCGAAGPHS